MQSKGFFVVAVFLNGLLIVAGNTMQNIKNFGSQPNLGKSWLSPIVPQQKVAQTPAQDKLFFPPYVFPFWGLPYGMYSNGGFFNPGLFPFVPGGPGFPPYDGIFGGPLGPGTFPGSGPTPFKYPPFNGQGGQKGESGGGKDSGKKGGKKSKAKKYGSTKNTTEASTPAPAPEPTPYKPKCKKRCKSAPTAASPYQPAAVSMNYDPTPAQNPSSYSKPPAPTTAYSQTNNYASSYPQPTPTYPAKPQQVNIEYNSLGYPQKSSSYNTPSLTSAYNNPSPPSSNNNPSPPFSYNNPSPPISYNNPSPPSSYNNPSPPISYNNPSPPSSYNNPSPPSSYNNPSPPISYNNPSPSSYNNPSPPISYNNPSPSSYNNPSPPSYNNPSPPSYNNLSSPTSNNNPSPPTSYDSPSPPPSYHSYDNPSLSTSYASPSPPTSYDSPSPPSSYDNPSPVPSLPSSHYDNPSSQSILYNIGPQLGSNYNNPLSYSNYPPETFYDLSNSVPTPSPPVVVSMTAGQQGEAPYYINDPSSPSSPPASYSISFDSGTSGTGYFPGWPNPPEGYSAGEEQRSHYHGNAIPGYLSPENAGSIYSGASDSYQQPPNLNVASTSPVPIYQSPAVNINPSSIFQTNFSSSSSNPIPGNDNGNGSPLQFAVEHNYDIGQDYQTHNFSITSLPDKMETPGGRISPVYVPGLSSTAKTPTYVSASQNVTPKILENYGPADPNDYFTSVVNKNTTGLYYTKSQIKRRR